MQTTLYRRVKPDARNAFPFPDFHLLDWPKLKAFGFSGFAAFRAERLCLSGQAKILRLRLRLNFEAQPQKKDTTPR
jgi:hypothetical protein